MSKTYYKIHKLRIQSDFDLKLPSCFKVGRIDNPDLSVETGSTSHSKLDPVAPPYLFYGSGKLVHNYGFPIPCNFSIESLEGKTRIMVTDLYRKLPNINVDEIIDYVTDLKLLQKGLVKIHGAAVKFNNNGIMVVGWDGCGKSTLAFNFLKKGAGFLSDDTIIIDENYAYSYPKPIKMFQGLNSITRMLNNIPYANKFIGNYKRVVPNNIVDQSKIKYIFISRYGEKQIKRLSEDEAFKALMILAVYRTKRRDAKNLALAYCHYSKYDFDSLLESRRNVLKRFLKDVECYEITSRNPKESMELIDKTIGS